MWCYKGTESTESKVQVRKDRWVKNTQQTDFNKGYRCFFFLFFYQQSLLVPFNWQPVTILQRQWFCRCYGMWSNLVMTSTFVFHVWALWWLNGPIPDPQVLLQVGHVYVVVVVAATMGVFILSSLCCLLTILSSPGTWVPYRHSRHQVLWKATTSSRSSGLILHFLTQSPTCPCSASSALRQSIIHGVAGHIALCEAADLGASLPHAPTVVTGLRWS